MPFRRGPGVAIGTEHVNMIGIKGHEKSMRATTSLSACSAAECCRPRAPLRIAAGRLARDRHHAESGARSLAAARLSDEAGR
ncbi:MULTISPECIES: hypothetical protein [unclassified Lysobacter]|uniref:hypothetical protein n=1 Tax=unclassified Lysobacter TaxID=2635362 RepID=UPI001BED3B8B|nr:MULTISPECIES: hypothetical protein [unclassified Lysobacter]MBT2749200.1 hypothetical protein [Lysobacter sp. ISL-42]MBT2754090.1 hypothetical protein [Lysobacter sp. ISL-50]MBT2779461.1 hypothetical protein [Lysobacter sp. ISL-54]MBT2781666.1 hypothetical protein [Lysobacter sp. ISL-52]